MKFIVIGITDSHRPFFPPEVLEVIKRGKVFSGGKRHHEIVATLLPSDAEWIDITVPLDAVFERYSSLFTLCSSFSPLVTLCSLVLPIHYSVNSPMLRWWSILRSIRFRCWLTGW